MPACPVIETSRTRRSRDVAWNRSLSSRSSASRPTNGASRRSSRPRPRRSATTRSARHAGDRRDLALEQLLAGRLVGDRAATSPGGSTRRRARRPAGASRLEPGRRVDEVAGDHALAARAERHRGLAGQHAGARLEARCPAARTASTSSRPGPDRPLGVVLVGRRGAPDGHHGVADELLDRAAVAPDRPPTRARSSATGARGRPRGRGPRTAS